MKLVHRRSNLRAKITEGRGNSTLHDLMNFRQSMSPLTGL